tara:strand:- start:226 stop:480 length:255 start_codon:yes stop_codon:yes gene_type:complete
MSGKKQASRAARASAAGLGPAAAKANATQIVRTKKPRNDFINKPPKKIKNMKNGGPVKKPTNRKIKVRGTGAATKGLFARGPMA